jgi:hypothetical protein
MSRSILASDSRIIDAIFFGGDDEERFKVGETGITKINAYDENGSMDFEPWFAVYKEDFLFARVRAGKVEQVSYASTVIK